MSAELRGNATAGVSGDKLTPGEHLRAEIERLGLDQVAVSQATGVSRQTINNIVNGRQPISRAMAGKLGRLTGRTSDYWLRAGFPRKGDGARDRVKPAVERARPLGVGIMVNHQIVRAVKDGVIEIDPFDETNVQLASVDLTLDDFILTAAGERIDTTDGDGFVLHSGHAVNLGTREWIALPRDYIARVGVRTGLAGRGIIASHDVQVDPGFEGHLQLCVFNAGGHGFRLRGGMPIASLAIMPLSATPTFDERAARHLDSASGRDKVVTLFGNGVCDRLIRDEIRRFAEVETRGEKTEARIPVLDVAFSGTSAEAALAAVVQGALNGLKTLRGRPAAARDDRERYTNFFGALADRLHLDAEQSRHALASLGLETGADHAPIVALRDGSEVVLHLPGSAARISLRHMARQLREDPADLALMLTGLVRYGGAP